MKNVPELKDLVLQLSFFEMGINQVANGFVHEKKVPFSIVAQAISGSYEIISDFGHIITKDTEAFLAPANTHLRIIHHGHPETEEMKFRFVHLQFTIYDSIDIFDLFHLPPKTDAKTGRELGNLIGEALMLRNDSIEHSLITIAKKNEIAFTLLSHLLTISEPNKDHYGLLTAANELLPILSYIKDNIADPQSIDNLLTLSPLSRTALFQLFKKHLGKTPMEYIKSVRLHEAYKSILVSSKSISEISEQCGFVSENHFSREFKKKYDKSPLQVRNEDKIWF
ncbi:MAG: helix-turn-helix transcriptional regulator [Bacillota bacterium]